jgi:serine/threonine protein kinase
LPGTWNKGDVIINLYEVKDVIGEGGFGIVYKVYHQDWHIDLAVKSPNEIHSRNGSCIRSVASGSEAKAGDTDSIA